MPMIKQLDLFDLARARLMSVDEIYSAVDSNWLQIIQEDRRIERKPAGIHQKALGEYFSMWANTPPNGGIIAIGVEDKGELSGLSTVGTRHVNDLERTGDVCCPDARYETKRDYVTNADGRPDQILLIRVHYHEKKVVKTTSKQAFDRRGESKRTLTDDQIRELQVEKGEVSWEREPSTLEYPAEFDQKAIRKFAETVAEIRKLEHWKSPEDILVHRHLGRYVRDKFKPNKACALLFANDPKLEVAGCYIRFLRFDGTEEQLGEKRNQIKDEWIEGNLPYQLERAEAVIGAQLREFSRLARNGKFLTTPEYPKPAWFEAIVNAVGHRSYGIHSVPIFVKMFDDRLEVESPGGFMPFITPENIYDRHEPRNPAILEALFFWDRTKCSNEGTKRMRQTMIDLDLPEPTFRQISPGNPKVTVVLKNNVEQRKMWLDSNASKVVDEVLFRAFTEHDKRVINHVAEFGKISVTETVRITNKSWDTCKSLLNKLCAMGVLRHIHRKDMLRDPKAHFILAFTPGKSS